MHVLFDAAGTLDIYPSQASVTGGARAARAERAHDGADRAAEPRRHGCAAPAASAFVDGRAGRHEPPTADVARLSP